MCADPFNTLCLVACFSQPVMRPPAGCGAHNSHVVHLARSWSRLTVIIRSWWHAHSSPVMTHNTWKEDIQKKSCVISCNDLVLESKTCLNLDRPSANISAGFGSRNVFLFFFFIRRSKWMDLIFFVRTVFRFSDVHQLSVLNLIFVGLFHMKWIKYMLTMRQSTDWCSCDPGVLTFLLCGIQLLMLSHFIKFKFLSREIIGAFSISTEQWSLWLLLWNTTCHAQATKEHENLF